MRASKAAVQRSRRVFTPEQKATILRRHLSDKAPVSDLRDEYQLAPSVFYLRQKQALEHLTAALQDGRTLRGEARTASADRARIAAIEATIAKKDRVIAEVSDEYLDMKKVWGPMTARWVPPDRRDDVVDCVTSRSTRITLPVRPLLQRLGITRWKFARWTTAYGAVPTPHGPVPRDHWLTRAEQDGILLFHEQPRSGPRGMAAWKRHARPDSSRIMP